MDSKHLKKCLIAEELIKKLERELDTWMTEGAHPVNPYHDRNSQVDPAIQSAYRDQAIDDLKSKIAIAKEEFASL